MSRAMRKSAPHKQGKERANQEEDRLIKLIEMGDTIKRYQGLVKKVADRKMDVPDLFKAAAVDAFMVTADIMFRGDSDKVRLEASKDILNRAGHNATTKIQVGGAITVDHDTSKLELINLIMASARRVGIPTQAEPVLLDTPPKTIDVTPRSDAVPVGIDEKPPEGA